MVFSALGHIFIRNNTAVLTVLLELQIYYTVLYIKVLHVGVE